jgi:superfamily I DNA/RNA helicase
MERAFRAVHAAGMSAVALDERSDATPGSMAVGTMHLAKGLEFRAAAVVARDRDHLLVTGVQPVSEFLDDLRRNL